MRGVRAQVQALRLSGEGLWPWVVLWERMVDRQHRGASGPVPVQRVTSVQGVQAKRTLWVTPHQEESHPVAALSAYSHCPLRPGWPLPRPQFPSHLSSVLPGASLHLHSPFPSSKFTTLES